VLAVCAILYDGDGKEITRHRTLAAMHQGIFRSAFAHANALMPTMDAGGGCAVFDREKFLALGGFDEMYWPYYYEDTDLSYGAWKRGLRVLVEPKSIMYHRHAATIQHNRQNQIVCCRNACLFMWKNITDPVLLAKHFAWLAFLVPWRALRGNWTYLRGVWTAFRKLPQALRRRREMKPLWKFTDAEVWALVRGNGPSAPPGAAEASVAREPVKVASLPG
jgi:GT2 family glycosyltransferase